MESQEKAPLLRFSNFNDSWVTKALGQVSSFLDGRRKPIKSSERSTMQGQYPYYGASGIIDYINDYIFNEDIILLGEDGENIISRNLPLAFKVSGKCWINNHAHVIKPNDQTDIDFLTQSLERVSYTQYNTGTAQPKLNQEICRGIPLHLPSLVEQQKIAAFLTAVDDKIQQLSKKKSLLEQYKKGVMQQIFSRQIRFKDEDGNDYPDWEEKKKAKEVFCSLSNKKHNGELPILSASQEFGMIYREESGINIQSSDKSILSYKIVEPGDFVISLRSFQGGIDYSRISGICSPAYTILRNRIPINFDFYKLYFKFDDFIESLSKTVVGIRDGKQISYDAFGTLIIPYPSVKEQTKIANFLSVIDTKIDYLNKQVKQTKQFKKGLLQQMFV